MLATKWLRRSFFVGSDLELQTGQGLGAEEGKILTEVVEVLKVLLSETKSADILELFFDVGGQISSVVGL